MEAKLYLAAYNLIQFIGWSASLYYLLIGRPLTSIYKVVYVFQSLALLEIVNVLIGVVRANLTTTVVQVFSRLQVLAIHYLFEDAKLSGGNCPMLLAWCLVEVVRYPYLMLHTVSHPPEVLKWLRYS